MSQNCNMYNNVTDTNTDINTDIGEKSKTFQKPTILEIKEYCKERNNSVNAERFYHFYEAKNWYIGKNKMKNWKSAINTWEQSDKQNSSNSKNDIRGAQKTNYKPFPEIDFG